MRRIVHAFIDTNVIIHGLPLDQIDWLKLLDAKTAMLVLTSTVIGELDKLKHGREGRLARDRARAFVEQFRNWEEEAFSQTGALIRKGVHLRGIAREPIVASYPDLDPTIADDRIIAAMLDFKNIAKNDRRVLIAVDTLILAKAKAYGLDGMRLPATLERPVERDETEIALKKATSDLAKERDRRPKIIPELRTGEEAGSAVSAQVEHLAMPSDDEFDRFFHAESHRIEAMERTRFGRQHGDPEISHIAPHVANFINYLRMVAHIRGTRARTFRLALRLTNGGNAPASQVQVEVHVPDRFEIYSHTEAEPLRWPPVPQLWNTPSLFRANAEWQAIDSWLEGDCAAQSFRDRSRIRYDAGDLLHESPREMRGFLVVAPEDIEPGVVEIRVIVRAAQLPKQETTTLQVRLGTVTGGGALDDVTEIYSEWLK